MTDKEKDAILDLIHKSKYLSMYTSSFLNHLRTPDLYGCPDLLDAYTAFVELEVSRTNMQRVLDGKEAIPTTENEVLSWRKRLEKLLRGG